jgi:hypothetical protein
MFLHREKKRFAWTSAIGLSICYVQLINIFQSIKLEEISSTGKKMKVTPFVSKVFRDQIQIPSDLKFSFSKFCTVQRGLNCNGNLCTLLKTLNNDTRNIFLQNQDVKVKF